MARKRYKAEEIVAKLRQVDVLTSQGQSVAEAIRQIGVSEVTYYRWRQEFGGLRIERLRELELENSRLLKAVSDLDAGQAHSSRGCPGETSSLFGAHSASSFLANPQCQRSSYEALASLRGQYFAAS